MPQPSSSDPLAVEFEGVSIAFDDNVVLRDVSFVVPTGRMTIMLGASGSGKSVALKLILGLLRPDTGRILVNGHRVDQMSEYDLLRVRADVGMLFQETALFDSLTVGENVGYRLSEELREPEETVSARVQEVLGFVGLAEYGERGTSELSGGQKRRVAIARAMASNPKLLLLDDPTTGLDPITATTVNDEIVKLYRGGMRVADIAREIGTSEWTIHQRLNRMGVERRPTSLSPTQVLEAKRLYELGETIRQIRLKIGFSDATIKKALMAAGVEVRDRRRKH